MYTGRRPISFSRSILVLLDDVALLGSGVSQFGGIKMYLIHTAAVCLRGPNRP